jgi:hypothetical protein
VRANRSDTRIARCKVDQTLSGFAGVTFSLIIRRDAVADFDNTVGIRWRGESAHSDHDDVDLVHDGETDFPQIGFSRGLKLGKKLWRSGEEELAHTIGDAHAGDLFVLLRARQQSQKMLWIVRNERETFGFDLNNKRFLDFTRNDKAQL